MRYSVFRLIYIYITKRIRRLRTFKNVFDIILSLSFYDCICIREQRFDDRIRLCAHFTAKNYNISRGRREN